MRKPTKQERQEIINDIVRLHQLDSVKYHLLTDRDDIVGNENNTDEQQAEFILKDAEIVIIEHDREKKGVIFFEWNCIAHLFHDVEVGMKLAWEDSMECIYYGAR